MGWCSRPLGAPSSPAATPARPLDVIAEEAGFSKGVVYSQFAGKPDLFIALLEQRIAERAAQNAAACRASVQGSTGCAQLVRLNDRRSRGRTSDWGRVG